jgi:hypothetical protein
MKYVIKLLTGHRDKLNEKYVEQNNAGDKTARLATLAKVVEINHVLTLLDFMQRLEDEMLQRTIAKLKLMGWKAPPQCKE